LEYDFLPTLTGSVEGRFSSEKYNYIFTPYLGTTGTGLTGPAYPAVLATPAPATSSTSFFTPKFLLRWTPSEDLMIYASIAKGVKPGGYSTVATTNSLTARFGPEKLWNYEVGFKAQFLDRKVTLDTAAFYMDYTGKQVSIVVPSNLTATGFTSAIENAGGAEVKGIEADITVRPLRDLTTRLGYTYLDAVYTDYQVNANSGLIGSLLTSCTQVQIGTGLFCRGNLAGNRLERTPRNSITASARYQHSLMGDISGFLEGDMRYTSNRPLDEYNKYFIPASATVDLRIGIETDRWSLLAYVDNVFDQQKVAGGVAVGDTFHPGTFALIVYQTDPRRAGLRGSYKF
jgi:iron complex outermembrane receptor protein